MLLFTYFLLSSYFFLTESMRGLNLSKWYSEDNFAYNVPAVYDWNIN